MKTKPATLTDHLKSKMISVYQLHSNGAIN